MKIVLLESYYGGSHRRWAEELQQYSKHEIVILSLPARHWKWRMHGAAISLANQFLAKKLDPDLILATDMIDLSLFLSLTRTTTYNIPCLIYFHENQLSYPWSQNDPDTTSGRDRHYSFINYQSALVADGVVFNSSYHRHVFIETLKPFLQGFPDFNNFETIKTIKRKSNVLSVGIECQAINSHLKTERAKNVPCLIWNHRWEYDKNPELFFKTLVKIKKKGFHFRLKVLGKAARKTPEIFEWAKRELASDIVHFGYCETKVQYWEQLTTSDIIPVTSHQDFFGISVVEAISAGVTPLLPNRLAYPEHIPANYHDDLLYEDDDEFCAKLESLIHNPRRLPGLIDFTAKYCWENIIEDYDDHFERCADLRS